MNYSLDTVYSCAVNGAKRHVWLQILAKILIVLNIGFEMYLKLPSGKSESVHQAFDIWDADGPKGRAEDRYAADWKAC